MQIPDSHIFTIFGASGDLTRRKLIPALYRLYEQGLLPRRFLIMGTGRSEMSDTDFRDQMRNAIAEFLKIENPNNDFLTILYYKRLNYDNPDDFISLKEKLHSLWEGNENTYSELYYLATPPELYKVISTNLHKAGINHSRVKLIIEKPFGNDLSSATDLNRHLLEIFHEKQIYRIDHYLGKETVQNIMVTRFSNVIFEPLWNRNYIHHIEITSSESIGVGDRGGYYDSSGALRDMVQNHLLQLAGLIAMEPPVNADSASIRDEVVKVLLSLRPLGEKDIRDQVIRGQYIESNIRGKRHNSYRDEEGVKDDSKTETYAALKFYIDNWRWNGVPFYIRSGKRLPTRVTEVVIHFRETPHHIFYNNTGYPSSDNQLIIRIQPDEGILLKFGMKTPGAGFAVQNVNMDFHYKSLSDVQLPEAYERLLHDCMLNDSTLFSRNDAVELTWKFLDPVLELWKNDPGFPLYGYPSGTWGPEPADNLIEGKGTGWRYPCKNLTDDGIYCEL